MVAGSHGFQRRRTTASPAQHAEQAGFVSIRPHARGEKSVGLGAMLQDGSASTVAKQDTRVAVLPIDDRRKLFRADYQHRVVGAGHDELLANLQTENKAGA